MKKKVVCLMLIGTLLMLSVPMVAGAASCKKPAYNYMTLNFTGKRHNVKSRFTGIKVHSGKSVLNNKVTNTTSCFAKWRAADKDAGWQAATTTKPANKKSSMRDVKIYGYGKTREKYNKKAVRKGRPKGRRSTVIPPRQGQAASPCLRASLTLRAASAIGQPRG